MKDALGTSLPVVSVTKVDEVTYTVTFTASASTGTYSIEVGPNVQSFSGYEIDADDDQILGEDGDDVISTTFNVTLFSRHYDMGLSNYLMAGYLWGQCGTVYDANVGYGWLGSAVNSNRRGYPDVLKEDFCYSNSARTLAVDVPNGLYHIRIISGDWNYSRTIALSLEGTLVDTFTVPAPAYNGGVFHDQTYDVTVADGQLTMNFGTNNWAVNVIEIDAATE